MPKKSGFVTIIGRPNVGKSTLMNKLIGQKIAITSHKPQTTRNRIRTVLTDEERGQIVFVDTPGMIEKAGNKLGEYMQSASRGTLNDVDLILYLVEPSTHIGKTEQAILRRLTTTDVPVFLLINKTDTIQRDEQLPIIAAYQEAFREAAGGAEKVAAQTAGDFDTEDTEGADDADDVRPAFAEVIPISALKGKNTDVLIDEIFRYLPEGHPFFDEDTITDQTERQIIAEMIREKALYALNEEVPHGIAVVIDTMRYREKQPICDIEATIVCEKASHKGIIIGKGGSKLKRIGSDARYEIERLIETKANLKLFVKVKKDWRQSDYLVENFGYKKEEL